MSQTLQNQILIAKSMNGIISLSDGAGTTIENGEIITNDLNATNMDTTNMTLQNLNMTGSFEVPDVNDITTTYGLVSFANYGNSYFAKNLYVSSYLLPYFPLSTTSYRLGLNAMQYQTALSINTLCWGTNALQGTTNIAYVNEMPKSIVIGNNAFQSTTYGQRITGSCYNNVAIGDNACKNHFFNNTDLVVIGGQACSSTGAAGSRNSVIIGANICSGGIAGYDSSIVIGSNVLKTSGCNSGVVIGSNAFANANFLGGYANGVCVVGYNSGLNVIANNRLTIFGNDSGKNINQNAHNMIIGPEAGNTMVNNTYCTCIGGFSDVGVSTIVSATAIGVYSIVSQSHTIKVGGNDAGLGSLGYTRHQDLLIPQKNRLLCGTLVGAVASYSPLVESGEYIFVNSATTTSITLFTPLSTTTGSQNISNFGSRFTIVRTSTGQSNITINAPSGQNIIFNGAISPTYAFSSAESYVSFVCCNNGTSNATWAVETSQQVATGGFATGLSTNTINPYITGNQCDLWISSTASTINIGNQSTAQIINFSKINTNSIEPKTVGNDINLFTTTIASVLNLGNSGNIINAYLYLNPTIAGTSIHTGAATFNGGITATASQTINFGTNAPYMRGDNIVANSIGQTQIDSGYLDLFTNQTIPFGIKTFANPPVMSGASITATSIPNSALQTTVTLDNTASTFSALKTFSVAPVMSGASISSGTIGQTQISNGYLDLTTNQTITSGIKLFNTAPSNAAQIISGTGIQTFSITGGREVILANSGITQITFPVVAAGNIGQTFQILKSVAFTVAILIGPQTGSTLFVNNASVSNTYIAITCNSFTITATSTTNWVMYNNDNPEMTIQSKSIHPLSGNMGLGSLSSVGGISTISMGNGCLAACPVGYRNAYSVAIGAGCLAALTGNAQGMVCIGNNCMLTSTSNLIQNTTAIGSAAGAAFAITGGGNTLIGSATDFTAAGAYNYSTALGYGAIITASNQVVLGRSTETVIIPSSKVQYGAYQPNSVYQTINATNLNWSTSPPTPLPHFILFSCSSTTTVTLTLPAISNANIYEGIEFQFRRTNTFASATTTSQLQVTCSGTDVIYIPGGMTTAASALVLASGAFYGRLVCVNKTTTPYNWAYFP